MCTIYGLENYLRVNTLRVVDGSVVLDNADTGGASADKVAASVQTHVTETLDNEGLAAPAGGGS